MFCLLIGRAFKPIDVNIVYTCVVTLSFSYGNLCMGLAVSRSRLVWIWLLRVQVIECQLVSMYRYIGTVMVYGKSCRKYIVIVGAHVVYSVRVK